MTALPPAASRRVPPHSRPAYGAWLAALTAAGFTVPALASAWLHLPRTVYLLPYFVVFGVLLAGFIAWERVDVRAELRRGWAWGVLGAIVAGALTSLSVVRGAAGPGAAGLQRVFELLWLGVLYGGVDALLLTVLPVWLVWRLTGARSPEAGWPLRLGSALLALLASLGVTAAYHLGYVEFRGAALAGPLIGNTVFTLAYLIVRNPLAPLGGHIAMHVATVLYALDSAPTLPPHN